MTARPDNVAKRLKSTMKIGTHSGGFHCDELLACFMLTRLPPYKDADIIRCVVMSYCLHRHDTVIMCVVSH